MHTESGTVVETGGISGAGGVAETGGAIGTGGTEGAGDVARGSACIMCLGFVEHREVHILWLSP